jgi:ferredoxin
MPAIYFEKERKSLDVLPGTNLRTAALKSGIELYSSLHRVFHANLDLGPVKFPCGADVVELVDGKGVSVRSPEEEAVIAGRWFLKRKVAPNMRLACQLVVNGDITVRTMPARELDPAETKQRIGFLGVVGGFFLVMALMLGLIGLDLVKLI